MVIKYIFPIDARLNRNADFRLMENLRSFYVLPIVSILLWL
jgi:hypothetical protein